MSRTSVGDIPGAMVATGAGVVVDVGLVAGFEVEGFEVVGVGFAGVVDGGGVVAVGAVDEGIDGEIDEGVVGRDDGAEDAARSTDVSGA